MSKGRAVTKYTPWESQGVSELEYWKGQFLKNSKEAYLAATALHRVAKWQQHHCVTLGCEAGCPWDNAYSVLEDIEYDDSSDPKDVTP